MLPLINDPALAQLSAPPKREFRGVWVATVSNIDWPSRNTLAAEQQRAEFVALLDQHQRSGLNAVVVQVRAACDALYPSQLEPWSSVLTGQQGQAPGYDPLAFMIAEARRRGLEFHAWFNPYRAVSDARNARLAPNHLANTQPSWLRPYGNARYLDPGLPEVRAHVVRVIMDVARRYDVDAIHFDDYFYPYPETGQVFNDDSTFRVHARGFTNRADWRRDNVDLLVRAVADSLRAAKPWVKFGISPFGIWQNRGTATPLGSDTRGLQSFSEIFADSRKWAQQGWVDYLAPQLYWSIGFTAARYEVLVPWWAQNSFGRHLYIGQGAYRINTTSDPNWLNPSQMPNQLRLNRTTAEVNGSIFFSSRSVTGNLLAIQDSLRQDFYRHPALLPLVPWRDATPPPAPTGLVASLTRQGVQLRWDRPTAPAGPLDRVRQFVIYRFENNQAPDLAQARFIRAVTPTDTTAFLDLTTNLADVRYTYVITALDRLHNESPASNPASLLVTASPQASPLASLRPAYPNPAQTTARLPFNLASPGPVQLALHDLTGRPLAPLVEATLPAGPHEYELNVTSLPPGTYLWSLATPHFRGQGRLVVVR
ncbi:MAG: family 10 glycosylhydrolase [Bernardetiaceae bacterium]|nr:family 10 glycosylhydrolase [Bernardetiaceae bacterium]